MPTHKELAGLDFPAFTIARSKQNTHYCIICGGETGSPLMTAGGNTACLGCACKAVDAIAEAKRLHNLGPVASLIYGKD